MMSDTRVSSIVQGRTFSTSAITGRPLTMETPQSPLTALPRNSAYCVTIGLLRPSRSCMASIASRLA